MKPFFKVVLTTLSILIICVFTIEYLYKDYKTTIDKKFDAYNKQKSSQVILIGNSHVGCLNEPEFNGKTSFNFSIGGQDIFYFYTILKTVLEQENNIELVIIGVDYDLFGYDYKIANTMWLDRTYYKKTKCLYDSSYSNKIMASSAFFRSNRDFSYLFRSKKNIADSQNIKEENKMFTPIIGSAKDRAIEHSVHKFDVNLVNSNVSYLEKIIFLTLSKGVNIVLINLPKQNNYYNNYNQEVIEIGKKEFELIRNKYQVPVFDFWESPVFNDTDFVDGDHLSEIGAKKVLSIIEDSIINTQTHNNVYTIID